MSARWQLGLLHLLRYTRSTPLLLSSLGDGSILILTHVCECSSCCLLINSNEQINGVIDEWYHGIEDTLTIVRTQIMYRCNIPWVHKYTSGLEYYWLYTFTHSYFHMSVYTAVHVRNDIAYQSVWLEVPFSACNILLERYYIKDYKLRGHDFYNARLLKGKLMGSGPGMRHCDVTAEERRGTRLVSCTMLLWAWDVNVQSQCFVHQCSGQYNLFWS